MIKNTSHIKRISKMMSLALRHNPDFLGIELDECGWTSTQSLLEGLQKKNVQVDLPLLKEVVDKNDKKRFAFNADGTMIRANQGHSISIDLQLKPATPPEYLYHGTVNKVIDTIREKGLLKMSRQYVHLSADKATAQMVGSRRGKAVILTIQAKKMHNDDFAFFLSENGVWLTDHVPVRYIELE